MVIRRSEAPRLNIRVTRTVRYASGETVWGTEYMTLERTVRARRLVVQVRDQIAIQGPRLFNVGLRRYLVRPSREILTFDYSLGDETEEHTQVLDWAVGDTLRDGAASFTVVGTEPFDLDTKMVELLVRRASTA